MGKLSRLRDMPTREIGYRLRERVRVESERLRLHTSASPWAVPEGCAPFLKRMFETRFYFSQEEREARRKFLASSFPHWIERSLLEAETLLEHRVELLGYGEVDLGEQIDWHRDPVTGAEWPRRFWADYDPVNDPDAGDSKIIHELNRCQHFARLGKAYFLSGDERFARETVAQFDRWIAWNPEGEGINWQSSLEIAIRAISWLWTIAFIAPSPEFTEPFARRLLDSLVAQMRHVFAYPSLYSSPNTHLIGEAAALFIAGSVLDGSEEARKWRALGADLLKREAERQILDDGAHCELSTCYHCYAADFYLHALTLAQRIRTPFSAAVTGKIAKMLDFVMHMTRPDGTLPQLGDNDGGRVLALDRRDYTSYTDGLCTGAALFQRAGFKCQAGEFREETFWLLGEAGWRAFNALPAAPPEACRLFPDAGYFVYRSGRTRDDSHVVFDCGGLGAPTGGHGHADALSLVYFAGGRDLLIDPGTGVYNAQAEWRAYFRSSAAHNTVVVDGVDQSEPGGTFQWSTQAPTSALSHRSSGDLQFADGEHRGYERLNGPVSHKRRLTFRGAGCWLINDELLGSGEHTFDFYFHFAPGVDVHVVPAADELIQVVARSGGVSLTLCFHCAARPTAEILQGWVSPRYGRREPAPVLRFRVKAAAPLWAATVVVPIHTAPAGMANAASRGRA